MPENSLDVEVDIGGAIRDLESAADAVETGAKDALDQLAVLAESAMKAEAPEGAGTPGVHMRSTIRTSTERGGLKKIVKPHKRTSEGWLLHRAIVGTPLTPSYNSQKPPVWSVDGEAQGPLAEWAAAKLGDRNAAWALRESIFESGHATIPNRFIDRSVREWESQADRVADRAIGRAIRGSM